MQQKEESLAPNSNGTFVGRQRTEAEEVILAEGDEVTRAPSPARGRVVWDLLIQKIPSIFHSHLCALFRKS